MDTVINPSMLKIIAAGVLGLPCFLAAIAVAPIMAVLSIPPLLFLIFASEDDGDKAACPDRVIISGGSSGIGLSIAEECVRRGVSKITIMARNTTKLEEAKSQLESLVSKSSKKTSKIDIVSVSVADHEALVKVAEDMQISKTERVVVWNCAGFAYPTEFEKVPIEKFEQQVMTNQLGAMYLVRAFLPHITKGCVVLTSSAAGQLGVYGLTTYAPTKYALRGFAETLHAELIRSHPEVSVQLAFPVDTDTPGYQEEIKISPAITKKISETGGLVTPEEYVLAAASNHRAHLGSVCFNPTLNLIIVFSFGSPQDGYQDGGCCLSQKPQVFCIFHLGGMDANQCDRGFGPRHQVGRCRCSSCARWRLSHDRTLRLERLVVHYSYVSKIRNNQEQG